MKYILTAIIAMALTGQAAFADKLMKFSEVEECVRLDHEIISDDEKLSGLKSVLDEKHAEILSLKDETDKLKARAEEEKSSGNVQAYNRLVEKYSKLLADYDGTLGIYNKLASEYKSMDEKLVKRKAGFMSACDSRRIFKLDLKKACRESPHSDTPFCIRNLKK
jgi:chromosome segregation ATPase